MQQDCENKSRKKSQQQLERLRKERRDNQRQRRLKTFHMHITPQQYRGMCFLGSYPDNRGKVRQPLGTLMDSRVALINPKYITNRKVLDLGSGNGGVALQVAIRMFPHTIVGMEIDKGLFQLSKKRIQDAINSNQRNKATMNDQILFLQIQKLPSFWRQKMSRKLNNMSASFQKNLEIIPKGLHIQRQFPNNISFSNQNFFNFEPNQQYDVILCLQTSKWVHLALGDTGLTLLFQKIYDALKPNGHLILQYPLWASYLRRRNANPIYRENIKNKITINPSTIPSYLKFLNLQLVEQFQSKQGCMLKHPIGIFQKIVEKRVSERSQGITNIQAKSQTKV